MISNRHTTLNDYFRFHIHYSLYFVRYLHPINHKKETNMIRAGITGGAGYTGGELISLLLNHPETEIAFIHSNSQHNGKDRTGVQTGWWK